MFVSLKILAFFLELNQNKPLILVAQLTDY